MLVEAAYGIASNSMALLADAGHNLPDVLGLVVAWVAVVLSRRPPSARYTYGLRSSSILAALFNAVFLLVAVGAIGWEATGVIRWEASRPIQAPQKTRSISGPAGRCTILAGLCLGRTAQRCEGGNFFARSNERQRPAAIEASWTLTGDGCGHHGPSAVAG